MHVFLGELCFELVYYVALCAPSLRACDQPAISLADAEECETLLKTPKQVNKTHKQQVCSLIITPLTLGAHKTTC